MLGKIIKSWLKVSKVETPAAKQPARRHWIGNPWHAVSVVPCANACSSVRNMSRVRFLSQEAPTLPLPTCAAKVCTCHYRHYQDRRHNLRRAADVMASNRMWPGAERRAGGTGRRGTD